MVRRLHEFPMSNTVDDDVDLGQVRPWIEFCAWTALVMTPLIWWLQGPSVSSDQFVVRMSMVVLSAIAAVGLRLWALFAKRNVVDAGWKKAKPPNQQGEPE